MKPANSRITTLLECTIDSTAEAIDPVCTDLKNAAKKNFPDTVLFHLELLAREFINNAIIHGNRSNPKKKVMIDLGSENKALSLTITDEGKGFNWRAEQKKLVPSDKATSGRGLSIGALYAKKIVWNRTGNSVKITL